jgi:hypothetical protein
MAVRVGRDPYRSNLNDIIDPIHIRKPNRIWDVSVKKTDKIQISLISRRFHQKIDSH